MIEELKEEKLIDKVGALSTTLPSNGSSLVSVGKGTQPIDYITLMLHLILYTFLQLMKADGAIII